MNSSRRSMFQHSLTRMHETGKNVSSALNSVQSPGSKVHGDAFGVSAMKKRNCMKAGGRYAVRFAVYFSLAQMSEKFEEAEAAASSALVC